MLASDLRKRVEETLCLVESGFIGMRFDGIGNIFLLFEVLFGSQGTPSGDPILKRVEIRLGGIGGLYLDRVTQAISVDNLYLTMNMAELGISEEGSRTVISSLFSGVSGASLHEDSRFEKFQLETNDFLLTVTFLEGDLFVGESIPLE